MQTDLEEVEQVVRRYAEPLFFRARLGESIVVPEGVMAHIFFYLPVALAENALFDAAQFFQQCLCDYEFVGGNIREILAEPTACPECERDRISLENLVLNSFRGVEALVGEPGQNDQRFRTRLQQRGIDADEVVGFRGERRTPIAERIRWLQKLRDETCSHGIRRRRAPITLREAMEAQHLAKMLIARAITHAASARGRREGTLGERHYLLKQMFGTEAMHRMRRELAGLAPEVLVTRPGGLERLIKLASNLRRGLRREWHC